MWQVRADKVILAQGAIERHMVFPDNDRPGILQAGAAQMYLNKYGVAVGKRIGVFTACDTAYAAAFDLKAAGSDIPMIVDARENVPEALMTKAKGLGIKVRPACCVSKTKGKLRVNSMSVRSNTGGNDESFDIDTLITSAGWTPSLHLYSQSRGKPQWNEETRRFLPAESPQDCVSVGLCAGTDELTEVLAGASKAGGKAVNYKVEHAISTAGGMSGTTAAAGPDDTNKAFVDLQNDVTAKDIRLAVREGMHSIEHVKRYTTNGMATDQGKLSNMHASPSQRTCWTGQSQRSADHIPRALHADNIWLFRRLRHRASIRPASQNANQ